MLAQLDRACHVKDAAHHGECAHDEQERACPVGLEEREESDGYADNPFERDGQRSLIVRAYPHGGHEAEDALEEDTHAEDQDERGERAPRREQSIESEEDGDDASDTDGSRNSGPWRPSWRPRIH